MSTKDLIKIEREALDGIDQQLLERWRPLIEYLEQKNRNPHTVLDVLTQIDILLKIEEVPATNQYYDKEIDTIEMKTLSRNRPFSYKGSVKEGTTIFFGQNRVEVITVDQYEKMLAVFTGKRVQIGTSFNNPGAGSLGAWLQRHVTKRAVASYVAPILIKEGYAYIPGNDKTEIVFR